MSKTQEKTFHWRGRTGSKQACEEMCGITSRQGDPTAHARKTHTQNQWPPQYKQVCEETGSLKYFWGKANLAVSRTSKLDFPMTPPWPSWAFTPREVTTYKHLYPSVHSSFIYKPKTGNTQNVPQRVNCQVDGGPFRPQTLTSQKPGVLCVRPAWVDLQRVVLQEKSQSHGTISHIGSLEMRRL